MKLYTGIFTLLVGILISCVAAYFSIIGLTALFAAAGVSIIIMGASLELGKIVAATWLKMNWADKTIPWLHKGYLLLAVATLMVITSIGIYGFLAAGHLEQKAPLAGLNLESSQFETRLAQKTSENDRLLKRMDQIDKNINSFIDQGSASRGLSASQSLKHERDQLAAQVDANNAEINQLNEKLAPLKAQSSMVEAKLGPVKYFSNLIGYGDNPEVAVQFVILLIMIPFDLLAVVLILSGMISINQWRDEKNPKKPDAEDSFKEYLNTGEVLSSDASALLDDYFNERAREAIQEKIEEFVDEAPVLQGSGIGDLVSLEEGNARLDEYIDECEQDDVNEAEFISQINFTSNSTAEVAEPEAEDNGSILQELEEMITPTQPLTREQLLDILDEHPSIISDLITVVKDMEHEEKSPAATPSDITGGTFD